MVELEKDTVGYAMETARSLGNSEMLRVSFQVELEKYETAIAWLQELCWNSIFDVERLRAINTRLLADVPMLSAVVMTCLQLCTSWCILRRSQFPGPVAPW